MTHHTSGADDLPEALFSDAVKFAKEKASISYVQRKCRCSYNDAARMLERMVSEGIIANYNGRKEPALAAGQAVAPAEPTPDELRAIAREARNSSGSASDDCGPAAYVIYGWRAAMSKVATRPAPPAMDGGEDAERLDWMDKNIFHREMSQWDKTLGGLDAYNMWVIFAPKGNQGSARDILDAARAAQKEE